MSSVHGSTNWLPAAYQATSYRYTTPSISYCGWETKKETESSKITHIFSLLTTPTLNNIAAAAKSNQGTPEKKGQYFSINPKAHQINIHAPMNS